MPEFVSLIVCYGPYFQRVLRLTHMQKRALTSEIKISHVENRASGRMTYDLTVTVPHH